MDETTTEKKTNEPKIYEIGDKRYRQEPLSFLQVQWFLEYVLDGNRDAMYSDVDMLECWRKHADAGLGIVLLEHEQTRYQKTMAGFEASLKLGKELLPHMTAEEVRQIAIDFFRINPIWNLWPLLPSGPSVPAEESGAQPSGSTPVSVSLPAETSRSEIGSGDTRDLQTVSSISVGSSSGS